MITKNKITKTVLLGLVALSVFLIAFALDTPQPVQADAKYPCDGYICIELTQQQSLILCGVFEPAYAYACSNWCYQGGVGFCEGIEQCQPWCPE